MASILVVDDDSDVRELLTDILKRAGHEIGTATNGLEALHSFRGNPRSLIITDLVMPEKEGLETIQELREEFPDVRIIAISGGGMVGPRSYLSLARALGAVETLTKPFAPKELLAAVDRALVA